MSDPSFVHLRVHSEYSLIDSVVRVGALTARAADHAVKLAKDGVI